MAETIGSGIRAIAGKVKAQYNQGRVNDKFTTHIMKHAGLEPGIMGETNYNKAYGTIKGHLTKNNLNAAHEYANFQAQAIRAEQKPEKTYSRIR